MADDTHVSGGCFCGAVRFTAELPSLFCAHCHCTMCRRSHGAGFVTWFAVPPQRLHFDKGESELVRFPSSDHGTRSFCGRCGSTLFCDSTRHPERIDIVLANMDGPIDQAPSLHCYWDDRADWIRAEDGLPRLGGGSGLEPLEPE
jgi:hypothetical protein